MDLSFVDSIIERFNSDKNNFSPHELSYAINSEATDRNLTEDQQIYVEIEAAPWELHLRERHQSCWGTYYAPSFEKAHTDGTKIVYPDIPQLGIDALTIWQKRLNEVGHPVMVARYADVLWDLAHVANPAATRDYRSGQVAVDAYAQIVENFSGSALESSLTLRRALQVATELNDPQRIDCVSEKLIELAASVDLLSIGVWTLPARAFAGNHKISVARCKQMVDDLERRLDEASRACNGYAANASCEALLNIYMRHSHRSDRHRILRVVADTYVRQAATADPNVAVSWLMPIAHVLEVEGLAKEAEPIRLEIERRGPECLASLKKHSVTIQINLQEIDRSLDETLSVDHPFGALLRLARRMLPSCERLRDQVKEHEKEFIFYSLFPRTILGHDGLPRATIGSSQDDPIGRMVEEVTTELPLKADLFNRGYQKAKIKFSFTADDLMAVIASSWLVTDEMLEQLKEAITAYDNQDYTKTLSILVHQIEAMLRGLLKLIQVPVRKNREPQTV